MSLVATPQHPQEATLLRRSNPWRPATFALGLIAIVLLGALLWIAHSQPTAEVKLYNNWSQSIRLVGQSGAPLSLMYERGEYAAGMAGGGWAVLGPSGGTAAHVASDVNHISDALSSILYVMRDRRAAYPQYAPRSMRAFQALLTRHVFQRLPRRVRSEDQLSHLLPTLDAVTRDVEERATAYASNVTASP